MYSPSSFITKCLVFLTLNFVVLEAMGVSISARRLYLDPQNNATHIRVLNMEAKKQNCEVEIKDIFINDQGRIALADPNQRTENSAKPLIRTAPRRFSIGQREHQLVKLLYRRKPGVESGEFQGVLAIKCKDEAAANSDELVIIQPTLVHNVPVIVRTANLPIQAEFTSVAKAEGQLTVEIRITGQRSITGDLKITHAASGELITEQKDISIYAQQPLKTLSYALDENSDAPLLIQFSENPNFGGNLMIQHTVN